MIGRVWQKIKSWKLGKDIQAGRAPRGRVVLEDDSQEAPFYGTAIVRGELSARKIAHDGTIEDHGVVSTNLVTRAWTEYLVDAMQNSSSYPMDVFVWHQSGTGTTPESNTQTSLVSPVGSRVNGTKTEGASANIYKSVATISYTSTYAITEHGLFSASSGGTMLDRSVFSAINVANGDSIEFTYQLTVYPES